MLSRFENFPRTTRLKERDNNFTLQVYNSNFTTYEVPTGRKEAGDTNKFLIDLMKANVSIDITTMKSQSKTQIVLRFDKNRFKNKTRC